MKEKECREKSVTKSFVGVKKQCNSKFQRCNKECKNKLFLSFSTVKS